MMHCDACVWVAVHGVYSENHALLASLGRDVTKAYIAIVYSN